MAFDTVNAIAKIKGMETCSGPGPRQNRHKRATGTCFINCSPELPQVYRSHRQQPRTRHEATQRAIMFEHGRTYKIVNAKAGNVLDLSGSDNRSLIGWDWHGGHNQQVRALFLPPRLPLDLFPLCNNAVPRADSSRVQWRLHHEDGAGVLRNRHTDKYLGIEGEARDGTPVIAVDEPFHWHIVADEEDPSTFRCASLSLIASPVGFVL